MKKELTLGQMFGLPEELINPKHVPEIMIERLQEMQKEIALHPLVCDVTRGVCIAQFAEIDPEPKTNKNKPITFRALLMYADDNEFARKAKLAARLILQEMGENAFDRIVSSRKEIT